MPEPTIHCPFCAHDITFLAPAFTKAPAVSPYAKPAEVPALVSSLTDVYDRGAQDFYWKKMRDRANLWAAYTPLDRADRAASEYPGPRKDGSNIVHMMFDKPITPRGGLIHGVVQQLTATQPLELPTYNASELGAMGYAVEMDGDKVKIKTVDDVPVGNIWNTLQYWGGGKQHHRWHMEIPIFASPRRNDCPAFMDDNALAFQVWFEDTGKLHDAITNLVTACWEGIETKAGMIPAVGIPIALLIA
jgi:hypothetical protein